MGKKPKTWKFLQISNASLAITTSAPRWGELVVPLHCQAGWPREHTTTFLDKERWRIDTYPPTPRKNALSLENKQRNPDQYFPVLGIFGVLHVYISFMSVEPDRNDTGLLTHSLVSIFVARVDAFKTIYNNTISI